MKDLSKIKIRMLPETAQRHSNVSDADYFGAAYKQYVSNSSLKYINPDEGGSPSLYKSKPNKQSSSMELGTAVHRIVLERAKYILSEYSKPSGKLAGLIEHAYKLHLKHPERPYSHLVIQACGDTEYYGTTLTEAKIQSAINNGRDYFDFLKVNGINDSLIMLAPEVRTKFLKIAESIDGNKDITSLIQPSDSIFDVRSFSEDVIIMNCEAIVGDQKVIIPLKCKIDNWSIDLDNKIITLNDLKTSGRGIGSFMPAEEGESSFDKWHYHRQMGMYTQMLISHCVNEFGITDIEDWTVNVNMMVAETIAPFNSQTFPVSQHLLTSGEAEMNKLLSMVAWCEVHGYEEELV